MATEPSEPIFEEEKRLFREWKEALWDTRNMFGKALFSVSWLFFAGIICVGCIYSLIVWIETKTRKQPNDNQK